VDHGNFLPRGSHPQLDPLWSTERVEVVHDYAELDRAGKLAAIVRDRPGLLEHLHVCFTPDSAENCGRCAKCLLTMACLQAAGAGGLPSAFPGELDLDALRKLSFPPLMVRFGFNKAHAALPPTPEHEPLRDALAEMLRRSSRADWDEGDHSIYAHQERLLRAIWSGETYAARAAGPERPPADFGEPDPSWPPPSDAPGNLIGLLATVDEQARRHVYGAGLVPPGRYLGELGALLAEPPEGDAVALRLDAGQPVLESLNGSARGAAARWALAPLRWPDLAGPIPRMRSAARRAQHALRALRTANGKAGQPAGEPAGWLHSSPAPGRIPLFAARHPAVDDVLLTTEEHEAEALGYGERRLLGYLEASAPASGRIGVHRPPLAWTHRWGQLQVKTR
jgi:hypothetical protein